MKILRVDIFSFFEGPEIFSVRLLQTLVRIFASAYHSFMELQHLNIACFLLFCVVFREAWCDRFSIYAGNISKYLRQILTGWRNLHSSLVFRFWISWISQIMSINFWSFDKPTDIWRSFPSYQITIQTHHVYSTLKRRENDRFHVVSTWQTRGVFLYGVTVRFSRIRNCQFSEHFYKLKINVP